MRALNVTALLNNRLPRRYRRAGGLADAVSRITRRLREVSRANIEEALRHLETDLQGLTEAEVERRRARYGSNQVAQVKAPAWYAQLALAFANPFIAVLALLASVSLVMDVLLAAPQDRSWRTVIVISVMVTVSALLRFWQEYRSNRAAEQLKAMVRTTATVQRAETGRHEVLMADLVPGDLIHLSAGDMIPADVRLLSSKDLFISQAVLTGESLPVEKYDTLAEVVEKSADAQGTRGTNPLDLPNICFMGTNVTSGTATAVVVGTGTHTYFGSMARELVGRRVETSFDRGINSVSWLLIRFMAVMVSTVFVVNGLTKHNWLEALFFGLSVAVGLTPEMLPMIVTANLAKGAVAMARRKTVVKRLNSIQSFGAMDVLCTDKTGTLTLDEVVLERHLDIHGHEREKVLEYAYLNSFYQTGLKNLLDVAVLKHGKAAALDVERRYRKIDEVPFDFRRRRMSVVLANGDGRHLVVCKGAVEEILSVCAFAEDEGEVVPLTDETRLRVETMAQDLNAEGLRVLGVGYRRMEPADHAYGVLDEREMVLAGYIGFLDPPKETAGPAVEALKAHGVQVKILTGDNEAVTRKICKEVGLTVDAVLLGEDVERMSDAELAETVDLTTVFAKLTPLHKSRVINALKRKGHTVGYLGDGINDAAALRDADVGISVDTAVDIAKEAADIILLEKSLMVLEEGVISGRRIFGNIIKYVKMTASSNFGNMFSVLGASALLPFLPMQPIHILINNLLYDLSQVTIPWDSVDEEYLRQPRKWNASDISRFMICIGPISSIFDYATYLLMWFVFAAATPARQGLFQTGWFVESLLSQTLIVHMIRTRKIPFIQSRAAKPVLLLTGAIMGIGMLVPFTPLGAAVGMWHLPPSFFLWLLGMLLTYCVLTQTVKVWYIKRFKAWL